MSNKFKDTHLFDEIYLYRQQFKDTDDYENQVALSNNFGEIASFINSSPNPDIMIDFINRYYNGNGLLSPLTLNDDEFPSTGGGKQTNKRCPSVIKDDNGNIYYTNAYSIKPVHVYNINENREVPIFPDYIDLQVINSTPIWITKGGCSTGKYIDRAYLHKSTIDKHYFIPHPPVILPVSVEISKPFIRVSIDAREPKIKVLKEFYDLSIKENDCKFDIRKYQKLKN